MPQDYPDLVLEAAKKTAAALEMPWAEIQPFYRSLQSDDEGGCAFLPKSVGRKIFTAHPNYIMRLLVAVGFSGAKISSHDANYITFGLSPQGGVMPTTAWPAAGVAGPLEVLFAQALTDPDQAQSVDCIVFDPAEKRITFRFCNGKIINYLPASSGLWRDDDTIFRSNVLAALRLNTKSRVSHVVKISGEALAEIARSVNWRTSASPVRIGDPEEEDR